MGWRQAGTQTAPCGLSHVGTRRGWAGQEGEVVLETQPHDLGFHRAPHSVYCSRSGKVLGAAQPGQREMRAAGRCAVQGTGCLPSRFILWGLSLKQPERTRVKGDPTAWGPSTSLNQKNVFESPEGLVQSDIEGKAWVSLIFSLWQPFSPFQQKYFFLQSVSENSCWLVGEKHSQAREGWAWQPGASVQGSGHCHSSTPRPLGPTGCPRATEVGVSRKPGGS